LEVGEYPGLSSGLSVIPRVLIRGRQEGQHERGSVRGQKGEEAKPCMDSSPEHKEYSPEDLF
jgi:hypothetical protein